MQPLTAGALSTFATRLVFKGSTPRPPVKNARGKGFRLSLEARANYLFGTDHGGKLVWCLSPRDTLGSSRWTRRHRSVEIDI